MKRVSAYIYGNYTYINFVVVMSGPPAGYTQRATIDAELGTIHILLVC